MTNIVSEIALSFACFEVVVHKCSSGGKKRQTLSFACFEAKDYILVNIGIYPALSFACFEVAEKPRHSATGQVLLVLLVLKTLRTGLDAPGALSFACFEVGELTTPENTYLS